MGEDEMLDMISRLLAVREQVTATVNDVYRRLAAMNAPLLAQIDLAQWVAQYGPEIYVSALDRQGLPTLHLSVYYKQQVADVRRRVERVAIKLASVQGDGMIRVHVVQRAEPEGDYYLGLMVVGGVIEYVTLSVDRWGHEMPILTDRLITVLGIVASNYWFVGGPVHEEV